MSGSYAFYTVFNNSYFATAFGLFWGTLIFFLDWYLVGSLRKQNNLRRELMMSLPRFILAIFLGIVISKPVELKLFEKEINAAIARTELQTNVDNKKLIDKDFSEIEQLRTDNESMALQLKLKEQQRNELFTMVVSEAEGRSVTGKFGKGPVYQEKKTALDHIERELKDLSQKFLPMIDANTKRIEVLSQKRDVQVEKNKQVVERNDGFLARIENLNRLGNEKPIVGMVGWFIMLLFICIESAPMLVKLLSQRGPYDELFDVALYEKQLEAQRLRANLDIKENTSQQLYQSDSTKRYESALAHKQQFVEQVHEAQTEINSRIVDKWKERELEAVEKNFDRYLPEIEDIVQGQAVSQSNETKKEVLDGSGE